MLCSNARFLNLNGDGGLFKHFAFRVTPAMEAGISNHVWDLSEAVALIDVAEKEMKLAA